MASYDDYMAALPPVTFQGQSSQLQRQAVARNLSGSQVPPEHVARLSGIHTGVGVRNGAGALYDHKSQGIVMPGNPDAMSRMSPGIQAKGTRTLAHEVGHGVSHTMNPVQFGQFLATPNGRGLLEAHAENYADQAVPGSFSGYDYEASQGRMPDTYQAARGPRFGNIDPRLSGAA